MRVLGFLGLSGGRILEMPHLTFGFTGQVPGSPRSGVSPLGVQSHAAASLLLVAVAETRDSILVARAHLAEK